MGKFEVSEAIRAPTHIVWARLADIGTILMEAEWNTRSPGVEKSYTTDPLGAGGLGESRHNEISGYTVVTFEEQRAVMFRNVKSKNLCNLPFKSADIRLTLCEDEDDARSTIVTCSSIYKPKYGLFGEFLDAVMVRKQYRKLMKMLLAGLKEDVEREL